MLLVKLENQMETVIFLNGEFPRHQFRSELERYLVQERFEDEEQKEAYRKILLEQARSLEYKVEIQICIPTQIIAQSGFAEEIKNLYKGDRVTKYSNATYKIKRAFWNRVRIFFNF